jgi:hypothetical protein
MKKIAPIILIIACTLSSCAREDVREEFLTIRTKYIESESFSISADIREELKDKRYDFSVEYTGNGDTGRVKITKPEEISGISVSFGKDGKLSAEYEGISLILPELYDERLSPAAVIPFVLKTICSAYINECRAERVDGKDYIFAEFDCGETENGDRIICAVWLSCDGEVNNAECSVDGETLVYIDF